ncbi:hypothetical protein ACIO3R_01505 [Streptomyces sp. NPDC087428]|uniref:hypothetical protein n=1 Tax=Streptomyces sp. NPDC087428 TaxID=3365788 RepID=UPI00380AE271
MSPERVDRVRVLAAAGLQDRLIAEELGVSWRTVLRARARHGIPSTWRPPVSGCGTPGAYKRGCRCKKCRAGNVARLNAAKTDRYARRAAGTAQFTHGANAYGNWDCRCDTCSREHSTVGAAQHQARKDRRGQ